MKNSMLSKTLPSRLPVGIHANKKKVPPAQGSGKPHNSTTADAPEKDTSFKPVFAKSTSKLKKAIDWLDEATSPQPDTAGNYKGGGYLPVFLGGALKGATILKSPLGIATIGGAAVGSKFVLQKTGSKALAMATGAAIGGATTAALLSPTSALVGAAVGGLVGAYQLFAGSSRADTRGAGNFAVMAAGLALPGPTKVVGGMVSAATETLAPNLSTWKKAAIGGAAGVAVGAALAAMGASPVGMAASVVGLGLASAAGPLIGPRFTQGFRNLSKYFGKKIETGLKKAGIVDENLDAKVRNGMGALPASIVREGTAGMIYSDGSLYGFLAGAGLSTLQQIAVFASSKTEKPANEDPKKQEAKAA